MIIPLLQIENEYKARIERVLKGGRPCPDLMLEISSELYHNIKAEGIVNSFHGEEDALLFNYGVHENHFALSMARRFEHPKKHESYQLVFMLLYERIDFIEIDYHFNCRSADYIDLNSFITMIKSTKGFKTAKKFKPAAYTLTFGQN
jgi:hypothetical protein